MGKTRFSLLLVVGGAVIVTLLVILVDAAVYYNKVHAGISVAGQNIGGLTEDEAIALLNRYVDRAEEKAITLVAEDQEWEVLPSEMGVELDVAGAVDAAMAVTRESNLFVDIGRRLKLLSGSKDLPLQGTVDSEKMDELLAEVAETLDEPAVDAALIITDEGELDVIESKEGRVVDQEALRTQLEALLFTFHSTELEIPMVVQQPNVEAADNQAALEQGKTMLGSPLTLTSGDKTWTFTPKEIATFVDFTSEERGGISVLVPFLSAEKMSGALEEIAAAVTVKAVDAYFDSDGTQAWVVPGVQGKTLDVEKTAEALNEASLRTTNRTVEAVLKVTDPDRTTEEAEAMGIKDKLAGYTTTYVGTAARQHNVDITTDYATDVILAPGQEYNFLEIVGPRTPERGYLEAKGIVGPGKLEDVFGGGICQVSTTIFNAAFFAGLEITERRNHSIYIDHYPKGRDATVSDVSPNLRFVNDTDHYIWIRGVSDGIETTFNIYGTDDGRRVTYTTSDFYNITPRSVVTVTDPSLGTGTSTVNHDGQDGKQCLVTRTITWPDGTKKVDKFVSTYPAIPKEIAVGTATATTTTTASTTTTTAGPTTTQPPETTTTEPPVETTTTTP
jgi:vancomycin resistance protein YoaR